MTHLETLRERMRYLTVRIIAKQTVGWDHSYDERERAALEWALGQLEPPRPDSTVQAVIVDVNTMGGRK